MSSISSNGAGGGDWSATGTWSGGSVPANGDDVTIVAGDTVNFDVDQSGFADGIAGLDIAGILEADDGDDRYLKSTGHITQTGSGEFKIGSSGTAWPISRLFTIDFNSNSKYFSGWDGGIAFYCAEPDNQYVKLDGAASATDTVLSVDTDVTGDIWAVGDTVWVCNVDNGQDEEEHTIAAINAGSIELSAGLSGDKVSGSYLVLGTRNIKITGSTSYAFLNFDNCYVGAEVSGSPNGYRAADDNTIAGSVAVDNYGFIYCHSNTVTGAVVGHGIRGFSTSDANTITGPVVGNNYGIYQSHANVVTGPVAGNNWGFYQSDSITATGPVVGNNYGFNTSPAILMGAELNNNRDLFDQARTEAYNTIFDGNTEFYQYNGNSIHQSSYTFSINHDDTGGAFKSWTRGGITISDTGTKPSGTTRSYKHMPESDDYPVFMQQKIRLWAGQRFKAVVHVRKDELMTYLPRAQLIKCGEDPLVSDSFSVVQEEQMTDSVDTWEELELNWKNTNDYPVDLYVRTQAKNATGNVWFLVESPEFLPKLMMY